MEETRIPASDVITAICEELEYSRAHVASILRKHQKSVQARRNRSGRWFISASGAIVLKDLVTFKSGPRYKLGERGART